MNNKTTILLGIFVGIIVLATLFTFGYNSGIFESKEDKCYIAIDNSIYFKEGTNYFPIIKQIDCNLLEQLQNGEW